jgi:hypothetical protein
LLRLSLLSGAVPTGRKSTLLRIGMRVTRHPRMGAAEEPCFLCGNQRGISEIEKSGSCTATLWFLFGNLLQRKHLAR